MWSGTATACCSYGDSHGGFVAEFTVEGSFRLTAVRQHASTARLTKSGDSTVIHDRTRELASGGS